MKFEIKENGKVITCKMINRKIENINLPKIGQTNELTLYGMYIIQSEPLLIILNKNYKENRKIKDSEKD